MKKLDLHNASLLARYAIEKSLLGEPRRMPEKRCRSRAEPV